ncbi:MAG: YfhO family protein [Planctomycetes bacterium]|nr:YfhO family protein [Planctomycetota bacterium]
MQESQEKGQTFNRVLLKLILPLLIFCWPFLYLIRYIFPVNGRYTMIGNDFRGLYYGHKVYLLAHLSNFSFPLWSPSEGAGFPFYTNPFAQVFYPLNLLLVVWYKVFGGYNVIDYTIFTIFGVSIFALGLYYWLRQVNNNLRAVIFSVLVMSVSFKITEILRFPNAVHTAAWYPWVLYSVTKIMFSRSLKGSICGGILLIFSVICLCTAGYPYYLYYSQFLFVPYMLIFLIKPLRMRLFGDSEIRWRRALGVLAVSGIIVLLLCGPYLLGIKDLMAQTVDREGKDFAYSTSHVFNAADTVGSLVYPPNAQSEGWYFFSITALLLIMLYLFNRKSKGCEVQVADCETNEKAIPPPVGDIWIKLFFIIWIGVISYISYGRYSHLFILLWNYMPGFSSLRVWGRLNIILVPIIAWLLSLAYMSFESVILEKKVFANGKFRYLFFPIGLLTLIYTAVISIQLYLYSNKITDYYWWHYLKHLSPQGVWFIIYGAVAFVVILFFIFLGKYIKFRPALYLKITVTGLFLAAILEMGPVGTQTWIRHKEGLEKSRSELDMTEINKASFGTKRYFRQGAVSLTPSFNTGLMLNWYFDRYVKFLRNTSGEPKMQGILLGLQDGTKIFFAESIKHKTIELFLRDAWRYRSTGHLLSYDGDELIWDVQAPVAGYLSFIDNWDHNWKASVDDKPVEIELLFGTFKSVKLSPGQHRVRFYYQPKFLLLK